MKRFKEQFSPAMMVGLLALFVALGGTAWAIGKNSVGPAQLKRNAVTTAKIKNRAVTPQKIRGAVPAARNLVNYQRVGVRRIVATNGPDSDAARLAAPERVLFRSAPLTIYAKCFTYSSTIYGYVYIKTSQNGAVFDSNLDILSGTPFLNSSTDETERQLTYTSSGDNSASFYGISSTEFTAMSRSGTSIEGRVPIAVKRGNLPGGSGIYGSGDVCLFTGGLMTFGR